TCWRREVRRLPQASWWSDLEDALQGFRSSSTLAFYRVRRRLKSNSEFYPFIWRNTDRVLTFSCQTALWLIRYRFPCSLLPCCRCRENWCRFTSLSRATNNYWKKLKPAT